MTIEELNSRVGLGVQSVDGSMKGTLRSVHGKCGVIKLEDGRLVWLDAEHLAAWDKPAPSAEEVKPQPETEQKEEPREPETTTTQDNTKPSVAPSGQAKEAPSAKALIPEKAVHVRIDASGGVELADESEGVTAYDVTMFGWTVIYEGMLRRVLWLVPSRESLVLNVDGNKVEVGLNSGELF